MHTFKKLASTFKECLIPIIPPGAKLSDKSSLHPNTLGKIPGIYHKNGAYWTGFPRWSEHVTTLNELDRWDHWPDANIGINLRNHVAIDIDIDDQELISHVTEILEDRLPKTIMREREGSPRQMFFYYCPNNNLPAVQRVVFENKGMIEILARGRQAVLEGVHPSGQKQLLRGKLKQIKEEEIGTALDAIFYAFPESGKTISQPHLRNKTPVWREVGERSYRTIVETITMWRPLSGRHDALRDLIWGMLSDGRQPENVRVDAESIMKLVPVDKRDSTWNIYFKNIQKLIEGAIDRQQSDKVDLSAYKDPDDPLVEFPPPMGRMGLLADDVIKASPHPNLIVATATALSLVAGIVGRRFNAIGVGLNLYTSLLMPSGMGKDVITKFISRTLLSQFSLKQSDKFLGNQRYTGAKALMDLLHKKRSCVSVFTEAGIMFSTSLGDVSGLQRAVLDLFTKSGADDYTLTEGYSSSDNDIRGMRAPCFTMINESTPDAFVNAMKKRDAESTGELARMLLFNVGSKKSPFNINLTYELHPDIKESLGGLIDFCLETQEEEDPQAVNLVFEDADRLLELNNHFTDRYNELIEHDPFRAVMYSRSWIKMIKISALCAVLDHDGPDYSTCTVGGKYIDWALAVLEYEMGVLSNYLKPNAESPVDIIAKQVVVPRIIKLLRNDVSPKCQLTKKMREDQVFGWTPLMRLCNNNRVLLDIADSSQKTGYPRTGLEKVLSYMVASKMLIELEGVTAYYPDNWGRLYKLGPSLEVLMD